MLLFLKLIQLIIKHILIDFYSDYIYLATKLFKNAYRFHIVIHAYNVLNNTRVSLCKKIILIIINQISIGNLLLKMKQALKFYKESIKYIKKMLLAIGSMIILYLVFS